MTRLIYTHHKGELAAARRKRARNKHFIEAQHLNAIANHAQSKSARLQAGEPPKLIKRADALAPGRR